MDRGRHSRPSGGRRFRAELGRAHGRALAELAVFAGPGGCRAIAAARAEIDPDPLCLSPPSADRVRLSRTMSEFVSAPRRPMVPVEGIEPPLLAEHDFESCASTSSATRARQKPKPAFYIVAVAARQKEFADLLPVPQALLPP
jgi:hypothetical protein